jgi:ABC-type transporter Mla maintaining outer membrane lipid asymmetry ATPase subunit MlaF
MTVNTRKIDCSSVVVFVGPNSSGKSLALREIRKGLGTEAGSEADLEGKQNIQMSRNSIIKEITLVMPPVDSIQATYGLSISKNSLGDDYYHSYGFFSGPEEISGQINIMRATLDDIVANGKSNLLWKYVGRYLTILLDGRTRFELTKRSQARYNPPPKNILQTLFQNDISFKRVYKEVQEAFNLHLVIDISDPGYFSLKLVNELPDDFDRKSVSEKNLATMRESTSIENTSDGVQAYIGLLCAMYSGHYKAILIDEPEAFLHPSLARRLGSLVTEISRLYGANIFVATHSADFLMGCTQSSSDITVVRMQYKKGVSRIRAVPAGSLREMLNDPLLRSSNVMSSLFYDGVVVSEADADRVFYSEIIYRITKFQKTPPALLFVNAQNKQTLCRIMGPLREFGIPAAAIPDIDVIKEGKANWKELLSAAKLPKDFRTGLSDTRARMVMSFAKAGKDMKEDGGIYALEGDEREAIQLLLSNLARYGVFVVPVGELERWLPDVGVTGKSNWVPRVLEKMGSDAEQGSHIKPGQGDVWDFCRSVLDWISREKPDGVP